MLIAADDALKSAAEGGEWTFKEVDDKFREAIDLLCAFEKDFTSFTSNDPTSCPNIRGRITGEAEIGDKFKSASNLLRVLKENLHATVKFPSISISLLLNTDADA